MTTLEGQKMVNEQLRQEYLGARGLTQTFANYIPVNDHANKIKNELTKNPSKDYLMFGNCGTGKTHLGYALMHLYLERESKKYGIIGFRVDVPQQPQDRMCDPCGYVTTFDLARSFKKGLINFGDDNILPEYYYKNMEFLIIDEIGRVKNSEFYAAELYDLITYRYGHGKQTILISNLAEEELKIELGTALTDRVYNWYTLVDFNWESYRNKI